MVNDLLERSPDLRELVDGVREVADRAGVRIMEHFAGSRTAVAKQDGSPVTEADRDAAAIIESALLRLAPGIPILCEESASPADGSDLRLCWIVDPLDGTREFVSGSGEFTVNIALVGNGTPLLGVVTAPALGRSWWAVRGGGAWSDPGGEARAIFSSPVSEPLRISISRSHAGPRELTLLEAFDCREPKRAGSSLKFCMIAEGEADLYVRFGRTMEWDTAAAQILVEEAGGAVLDFQGRPLVYNKSDPANPPFAAMGDAALLKRLAPHV